MRQFTAFAKKEFLEQLRNGKIIILCILFCLFGIMNPAIAKMTPYLFKLMSEQLAENGVVFSQIQVDALTSWTQFYKNMPILLVIFIVMFSGVFTLEYQKGTLVNVITKGMKRWKILLSKMLVMTVLWTIGYTITFTITYCYTAYFWDNSIIENLIFSAFGYYFVSLWLISFILPLSSFLNSASAVTIFVGMAFIISYLVSLFPLFTKYTPIFLMSSNEFLTGNINYEQCLSSIGITAFLIIVNIVVSFVIFNKRVI